MLKVDLTREKTVQEVLAAKKPQRQEQDLKLQETITSFSYLQGLAKALWNIEGTNDVVTAEQAENLIKNKQMTVMA